MGVFSRFMDIVNANINSLLDKAEDPEKMIKLMMQEMEDTLIELKSACAAKMAAKAKTERNKQELEALIARWQSRAELAIAKGREDLAREALIEKKKANADIQRVLEDLARYDEMIKSSKDDISQLEEKLLVVKQKYQAIVERANRAREEQAAKETMRKASDADTFSRFSHMEDRIDRMQAENELNRGAAPNVDAKFKDLEELDEIEAELEALRKQAEGR